MVSRLAKQQDCVSSCSGSMVMPSSPGSSPPPASPAVFRWIKTECGRASYLELASRPGLAATLRRAWFVLIATIRDWRLPDPDAQTGP